jgi:hypothetical protein
LGGGVDAAELFGEGEGAFGLDPVGEEAAGLPAHPPLRCGQAPLIAVGDGSTSVRRWVDGLLLVSRDAVHLPNFEFATGIPC